MQEKHWYALYTRSRFEKKVKAELDEKGIETFLPLWKQLSQWSDRKKLVEMPVFKGYVFVRIDYKSYHVKVLESDGAVCFISFKGKIAKINEKDLNWIRIISGNNATLANDVADFKPGDNVKIISGPLKDIIGVVDRNSKKTIKINFESFNQNLIIEVPPEILLKI